MDNVEYEVAWKRDISGLGGKRGKLPTPALQMCLVEVFFIRIKGRRIEDVRCYCEGGDFNKAP
ncbi:hypothetical protein EYF80_008146 [Liparis tanakae]|uniref:Uncharacterized protein n=1 Tax=Liparis tanakae TaxID=230148 RepID=A0A4Z2IUP2_9TELE|nr:hypothetical protein EYF80_008146 [Liparis tanakae]